MKNKKAEPTNFKKFVFTYLIALAPLFIYGFYKNYLFVYNKKLISFNDLYKPLIILFVSLLIAVFIDFLSLLIKKEKITFKELLSPSLIYALIIFLTLPYKFNTLIYFLLLTMILILIKIIPSNKCSVNLVAIAVLIILLSFKYFGSFSYANIYETTRNISYNLFDSFFGRTIGCFGTTNIFLILLGYCYLIINPLYKKEIPIITIIMFFITGLFFLIIPSFTFKNLVTYLIETNFIFSSIYILPISFYSPYTTEGNIIFAILTGILSFLFMHFINLTVGSFIAIICTSALVHIIDFIILKIKEKGEKE